MIKGLSEIRRLPRIGKIRLGVKNKNQQGVQYPSAVDYFVFEEKGTPKEVLQKVKELYGERPQRLIIKFFSNDLEQIFPQFLKYYSKNQLICKGDGEIARRQENGEIVEIKCPYKDCPYYQQKLCRPIAHLKFYLEGIPGGFFQIDTSSTNSIINLNTKIEQLKIIHGNITNIPLELTLVPIQVQVKGDKDAKSFNKTVYILDIHEPNGTLAKNLINEPSNKNRTVETTIDEDLEENDLPEDFEEAEEMSQKEDTDFIPEGFEPIDEGEDPFAEPEENKEMLMLDKFSKIQIKGKDYVLASFLDAQNKTHNFIITNKDVYKELAAAKKSGKTPIIYNYRTEELAGYEVLIEYKLLAS